MSNHFVWWAETVPDFISEFLPKSHAPSALEVAFRTLEQWQTLASGVLAVIAAAWTVYFLRQQINIERDRDHEARKRAEKGARIRVAHALSPLSIYADTGIVHWARKGVAKDFPTLPTSAIDILMEIAKDVDDVTFESFRQLVLHAQILSARAGEYHSGKEKPPLNWREVLIYDLLYLKCQVNQLYKYGRDDVLILPFAEPRRADLEKAVPSLTVRGFQMDEELAVHNEIDAALNKQDY